VTVTLSILQKLQILLIRGIIAPVWALDLAAKHTFQKTYARVFVNLLLLFFTGILIYYPLKGSSLSEGYRKKVALWHTGFVTQIYGVPGAVEVGGQAAVLGSAEASKKIPVLVSKSAFPYISAKGHLIIDNKTNKILSEHNINRTFAPASTTKLMTALVAADLYGESEIVEISPMCSEVESTKLWMPVGSKYTVKNLLYSLLVSSAGDAGCALASSKLALPAFVELMNVKAAQVGMSNTTFTNPIGLDGADGSHYSSVWDLYLLSKKAMEDPLIREIVRTRNHSFKDITGELDIDISNTNQLMWDIPETIGVKTGRTSGAGEVLIYRYGDKDKDFTIIVMSSEDRFLDTRNLINWTLSSYEWM